MWYFSPYFLLYLSLYFLDFTPCLPLLDATPCLPPLVCHPLLATLGCRHLCHPLLATPWMPPLATLLLRVELVVLRVVVVLLNDDVELSLICEHIANKEGTTITANRSCIARYCVQISALLIPRR